MWEKHKRGSKERSLGAGGQKEMDQETVTVRISAQMVSMKC